MYSITDDYYELSVEAALRFGYRRITEGNYLFYRGECFVRSGKVWIHNLSQLMRHLNIESETHEKLKNYNLNDYFKFIGELQERENIRDQIELENIRFEMMENEREYLESNHCDFDEMSEYDQEYLRSCYRDTLYKPR